MGLPRLGLGLGLGLGLALSPCFGTVKRGRPGNMLPSLLPGIIAVVNKAGGRTLKICFEIGVFFLLLSPCGATARSSGRVILAPRACCRGAWPVFLFPGIMYFNLLRHRNLPPLAASRLS